MIFPENFKNLIKLYQFSNTLCKNCSTGPVKVFGNVYMSPKRKLSFFRKSGVNKTENKFFYRYINVSPKSE